MLMFAHVLFLGEGELQAARPSCFSVPPSHSCLEPSLSLSNHALRKGTKLNHTKVIE